MIETTTAVLAAVIGTVAAVGIATTVLYRIRKDRLDFEESFDLTADDSIKRLIRDVDLAKESITIFCGDCKAAGADDELVAQLKAALRAAIIDRHVKIKIVTPDRSTVTNLLPEGAGDNAPEIKKPRGRIRWAGRIIDGNIVEHHSHSDLVPLRGRYTRKADAPWLAERILEQRAV